MYKEHGFQLGITRVQDEFYLSIKVFGTLTHEDYVEMTPLIDSALAAVDSAKINALVDLREFEGMQARAPWDDFRFGLKYNNEFKNVAVVGNKNWQQLAAKISSWFLSGEVQFFDDKDAAVNWLQEKGE